MKKLTHNLTIGSFSLPETFWSMSTVDWSTSVWPILKVILVWNKKEKIFHCNAGHLTDTNDEILNWFNREQECNHPGPCWDQARLSSLVKNQVGVAPLIADPPSTSSNTLWKKKKKKWHVPCDLWHVTCDTWHGTFYTQGLVNIVAKFQKFIALTAWEM